MQTWLHKSPLMYFINICSSPPHLSWSSKPIPGGSHWNRQHHIWQLLFLYCILEPWMLIVLCPPTQYSDLCMCAYSNPGSSEHSFHSGTSRPHCSSLIDANLHPSWRSRFVVVKVRRERMPVCVAWDHFQAYFAVDYNSVRWHWHLDSAALTEHIHLKAQMSTKATE